MAQNKSLPWAAKLNPQLSEVLDYFLWMLSALLLVLSVVFKDVFAFLLFLLLILVEESRRLR